MKIRKTTLEDVDRVMEIYAHARAFMAAHGNPRQWGNTGWPPRDVILNDVKVGKGYVCLNDEDQVIGAFYYDYGPDIEPAYRIIEGIGWSDDRAYGVVHRIAGDGSEKGIGSFCLNWVFDQCGHMRIDTHGDNVVMQGLLKKLGFTQRGIVHVPEDDDPRLAYER